MDLHPIYLVSGPCGAGKTTWIHQQLAEQTEPSAYTCLGADATPIDLTYITSTCPQVKPITAGSAWKQLAESQPLYVEIAPQLDLAKLQLQADKIFCLGDLVGYGPHPNAVVDLIRSLDIPTVQGCWDEDIVEGLNACECSYPSILAEKRGKAAHNWTNDQIHPEVREYLAQLPLSLREENLCFVHGSPHNQHEYLMPEVNAFTALERVMATGADVLFCGHTHIPYVRTLDAGKLAVKVQQPEGSSTKQFTTPLKQIINAGSVGEPRHGRPNATYVIYDTNDKLTTLREVEYDYQLTCQAIIDKGLPAIFAWRLAQGLEYAERAEDPTHVCER